MKKVILLLCFCLWSMQAYATDYVYEAIGAWKACRTQGVRCDDVNKYTNSGINAYQSSKNTSITDLKSYCSLIYLRAMNQAWGNQEQWSRDIMELNGSCKMIGAMGL